MSRMVNEVLDFSRLRAGTLEMNMAPFNLTDAVRKTADRIARMLHGQCQRGSLRFRQKQLMSLVYPVEFADRHRGSAVRFQRRHLTDF